ncbi:MAG TPA: redoxin domain-containing protein [Fibrobacter sp.]|nr:redoxin domain-containing protein [Fibrobacter sp.]
MNQFTRALTLTALLSIFSFAQLASESKNEVPLMKDSSGNVMKMDFSKPLVGISDPGMLFSHFANKNLMIYYFSPKCVHCIHHFAEIQKIIQKYEAKGFTGIAIGLGGGIKKNDIRLFIDQQRVMLPVFQDQNSKFGPAYGTGYIPVLFLILEDGTFYRYAELTENNMAHLKKTLDSLYAK